MRQISATEAKQSLSAILDDIQREPVVIHQEEREVAVVLSMEAYERLRAANVREFQDFCDRAGREAKAKGLTEDILQQILDDAP